MLYYKVIVDVQSNINQWSQNLQHVSWQVLQSVRRGGKEK